MGAGEDLFVCDVSSRVPDSGERTLQKNEWSALPLFESVDGHVGLSLSSREAIKTKMLLIIVEGLHPGTPGSMPSSPTVGNLAHSSLTPTGRESATQ
jgi:hypothetical protein